jgi:hypothetical protein
MMVCENIWGIGIVLQVHWDSVNYTKKGLKAWIDHMRLNYDMILLLQHILYLYCIHDNILKWWSVTLHCCMWLMKFKHLSSQNIIACTSCVFMLIKSWTYNYFFFTCKTCVLLKDIVIITFEELNPEWLKDM